jgi:resuscitation-promoting factor RpfB
MRLYHSRLGVVTTCKLQRKSQREWSAKVSIILFAWLGLLLSGCTPTVQMADEIDVIVAVDGREQTVQVQTGSSVHHALLAVNITLGPLDRSEPAIFSILGEDTRVQVIRVREEFEIVNEAIPFQNQVLKNESMPEGETRLVQPGVNGVQEITYRRVYEDSNIVSYSPVKIVIVQEPIHEIVMVGSQVPFTSFAIPGRLVYMLGGNAWMIEGHTGNRRPVVTTGDLDGRIFSLSPDGIWLLFTRKSENEGDINHLWAARLSEDPGVEINFVDLNVTNVVHFADWKPGSSYTIAYSTVEPRASAPGWQANNDLNLLHLNSSGQVRHMPVELETNMGGNYGWWGMTFAWSPDGLSIAYARPDSIGLLDRDEGSLIELLGVIPLQTKGDWAWVPGLSWGTDGKVLYSVEHVAGIGALSPEESQLFEMAAIPLEAGTPVNLASPTGMFTYPVTSPFLEGSRGGKDYLIAYLSAIYPAQSETSRYLMMIMDRDGSNKRVLFPPDGSSGLAPQAKWGVWSPKQLEDSGSFALAFIYQENLWLVDSITGVARQITGDDLVSKVDWK